MKGKILFLLAAPLLFSAQTTITKAFHDPVIGDVVSNVQLVGTVDNSATGNGVTFSNPALTAGAPVTANYVAPTAAEAAGYVGSTIKMVSGANVTFYKQTANKLEITAISTPDATMSFNANNATFISYPAAYGYNEQDQAQGLISAGTNTGYLRGTITNTADAAGTLVIGTQTFNNVLRIKSIQNFTIYLDASFIISVGSVTNTSYMYFDSTHKFPLLTSTSGNISVPSLGINQNLNESSALDAVFLSVKDVSAKEQFTVYPNPVQDVLFVKGEQFETARIYSTDGKLIKSADLRSGKADVSEIPSGMYFIELKGKDRNAETAKFIKK